MSTLSTRAFLLSLLSAAAASAAGCGSGGALGDPSADRLDLAALLGGADTASVDLVNTGGGDLAFAITTDDPAITVDVPAGNLAPGEILAITVTGACDAVADIDAQLTITSDDPDPASGTRTIAVTLACTSPLGAPTPAAIRLDTFATETIADAFTVRNLSFTPVAYTITGAPEWLSVTPDNGTVAGGGGVEVSVSGTCPARLDTQTATLLVATDHPGDPGHPVQVELGCTSGMDIEIRFLSPVTPDQERAFLDAAARWSQLIVGDLPEFPFTIPNICGTGQDLVGPTDDLVIYATVQLIDGPSGTLAQAGPCVLRAGGAPAAGIMRFDSADIDNLGPRLPDVILHEMGHVLGSGGLWDDRDLLTFNGATCQQSTQISYIGPGARTEFGPLGGDGDVPVENTGGAGTKCSHWNERVFGNELMTGFIAEAGNPLSRMTLAMFGDMGYAVDVDAADDYSLPACSPNCTGLSAGLELVDDIIAPTAMVTPTGDIIALPSRRDP